MSYGSSPFFGKQLGPITVGQLIAIVLAMVISIALLNLSISNLILLSLIIAIVVYILPHLFGASIKTKTVAGAVFAIVIILIGGFSAGPSTIDSLSSSTVGEHDDLSVHYSVDPADSDNINVSVTYTGGSEHSVNDLYVAYSEVNYIAFGNVYIKDDAKTIHKEAMGGSDYNIKIDSTKLYEIFVAFLDADGNIDTNAMSYVTLTGFDYHGNSTDYTILGSIFVAGYYVIFFGLIVFLTWVIRNRAAAARKRMEDAGRLYPQGYGRCTFCGAIVLPGEVNCRKCGAYIDRPEYMKPQKKDRLTCSVCGAEITADMTECPKCGAKFDEGEEDVITHEDGTQDVSTDSKTCPNCGKTIPAGSERCIYCGKKFKL